MSTNEPEAPEARRKNMSLRGTLFFLFYAIAMGVILWGESKGYPLVPFSIGAGVAALGLWIGSVYLLGVNDEQVDRRPRVQRIARRKKRMRDRRLVSSDVY